MRYGKPHYEADDEHFSADAYREIRSKYAVAWWILGWHTEPDEDTEWSGDEQRSGRVVAVMVGDDHYCVMDEEDFEPMARKDYCGVCGQIGCAHDGLDRAFAVGLVPDELGAPVILQSACDDLRSRGRPAVYEHYQRSAVNEVARCGVHAET